ncbi:MAG: hypothetical protein D6680_20895 [Cyanobacteria bacterium J007]|nr:MAG: hypothetical protein D6680_20895 [Cyanobacteria bacterium J007]
MQSWGQQPARAEKIALMPRVGLPGQTRRRLPPQILMRFTIIAVCQKIENCRIRDFNQRVVRVFGKNRENLTG